MNVFHREPCSDPVALAKWSRHDSYDDSFAFFRALAPGVWLATMGLGLLIALTAVGYLSVDWNASSGKPLADPFRKFLDALPEVNIARRRPALAFSGVLLAITAALALASGVWAVQAFRAKANRYRLVVLGWVLVFFALAVGILVWMELHGYQSFASGLAHELLHVSHPRDSRLFGVGVPELMFGLACGVPVVLAAGACFLLQPMRLPADTDPAGAQSQLEILADRLTELDQLLYVGALTLVFGTLQLSAALSVPLASMPNVDELKIEADLCKTLPPASPASSPFFTPIASAASASKPSFHEGFGVERCSQLPQEFARSEVAGDLRQLTRGVTLAIGLAYSALLAAIYVPALIGLRLLVRPRQKIVRSAADTEEEKSKSEVGEVDPLRRMAAVIATLSPLIAGLLANVLGIG